MASAHPAGEQGQHECGAGVSTWSSQGFGGGCEERRGIGQIPGEPRRGSALLTYH